MNKQQITRLALLIIIALSLAISACGSIKVTGGNNGCANLACPQAAPTFSLSIE